MKPLGAHGVQGLGLWVQGSGLQVSRLRAQGSESTCELVPWRLKLRISIDFGALDVLAGEWNFIFLVWCSWKHLKAHLSSF